MDSLKLNEPEQRLYQELFHSCDVDGTGKVSSSRANELFRTTGLSQDTLHQITELCGAKRLGLFGRSQFYVALKLVSIAQSKLPVSLESLGSEVSLPDFSQPPPAPKLTDLEQEAASGDSGKGVAPAIGHLPPPPTKKHSRNLSGQYRGVGVQPPEAAPQATVQPQFQNNVRGDSPHKSPAFSPEQSPPISPPTRLRGSLDDSMAHPLTAPVHTTPSAARNNSAAVNSVHEAGWAQFENDEQHGLLGSGTTVKSWEHLEGRAVDSSSISSEAESVDDVWTISDEQRDYYITQFKTMQPDLNGVIKGNIAKEFFEKSRLPVQELSKIWQLSDFNKDGALSLEEFCTAMHLVVLKRNDVELPNHLPPSLMPYSTLVNDEPFASDLPPGSTIKRVSPLSPSASQWSAAFLSDSSSDLSSPVIKPVKFEVNPVTHDPEANIVHPVALRMSPDGHTFPPLEHLVDRSRTASDPVHYETNHDVPDMLTPSKQRSNTESYSMEPMSPSIKLHGNLQGRPRPVAKKAASATVPGQLQPPPTSQGSGAAEGVTDDVFPSPGSPQGEPPPPPPPDTGPPGPPLPHSGAAPPQLPPRPTMHNRSISVDLKLKIDGGLMPPPAVPPRISPRDGHKKVSEKFTFGPVDSDRLSKPDATKLKRFEPIPSQEVLTIINNTEMESPERKVISGQSTLERHRRAKSLDFHQTPVASKQTDVHNTDQTDSSNVASIPEDVLVVEEPGDLMQSDDVCEPQAAEISRPPVIGIRQASRDKRDVQLALRTHRERNAMLGRVNSELNQELQEVMEQRIALEIQLEHLRPFSS